MDAKQILEREFLEIRANILAIGASLDRIERADGDVESEDRIRLIDAGLKILCGQDSARAERIQLLFSREYNESWQDEFKFEPRF